MKIISLKICPYVQQVRVLLEAKKINYEVFGDPLLKCLPWPLLIYEESLIIVGINSLNLRIAPFLTIWPTSIAS